MSWVGDKVQGAWDDVRGKTQQRALEEATNRQLEASDAQLQLGRENLEYLREQGARAEERLQPYNQVGLDAVPQLNALLSPQGQMDYLQANPIFNAAIDRSTQRFEGQAAGQGKFNSGGLINELFNDYLSKGEQFITNQYNRLLSPVSLGQASAAGQAANIGNTANAVSGGYGNLQGVYGNRGDILSSSAIQQGNIGLGGTSNLLGLGLGMFPNALPSLGGALASGAGALGGAAIGGLGALSGLGWLGVLSDERAKEDIEQIGMTSDGIPIVKFRYKGEDATNIGVLAQDVEKVKPWAVKTADDGLKRVNLELV